MLKLQQVHAYYGKSHILQGVSLEVRKGELVTLLGRNGAGKTTTLKSIMGLVAVNAGVIKYKEKNIQGKVPYQICREGIGYVPQGRRIFSSLSVAENLKLPYSAEGEKRVDWVLNFFPPLRKRLGHMGNELSGGEQQMLAIARVLIGRPDLILLDEPSEGIAPLLVLNIMETIRELNRTGLTLLLVEANLQMATTVGTRHYVMASGLVTCEADSKQIMEDESLQKKYFKL
jgi:branched-chain amino acid transport system ATP-binding protein